MPTATVSSNSFCFEINEFTPKQSYSQENNHELPKFNKHYIDAAKIYSSLWSIGKKLVCRHIPSFNLLLFSIAKPSIWHLEKSETTEPMVTEEKKVIQIPVGKLRIYIQFLNFLNFKSRTDKNALVWKKFISDFDEISYFLWLTHIAKMCCLYRSRRSFILER